MSLSDEAEKRISEIADRFFVNYSHRQQCATAIRAALSDDLLVQSIKDAALERAMTKLSADYADEERFGKDAEVYNSAVSHCIAILDQLKGKP